MCVLACPSVRLRVRYSCDRTPGVLMCVCVCVGVTTTLTLPWGAAPQPPRAARAARHAECAQRCHSRERRELQPHLFRPQFDQIVRSAQISSLRKMHVLLLSGSDWLHCSPMLPPYSSIRMVLRDERTMMQHRALRPSAVHWAARGIGICTFLYFPWAFD